MKHIILAGLLFFTDFFLFCYMGHWLSWGLLTYFLLSYIDGKQTYSSLLRAYACTPLLALQDCFIYSKFGLLCIVLFPLMLLVRWLENTILVHNHYLVIMIISILLFIFIYDCGFKWLILGDFEPAKMTFLRIFITITQGYLVFFGVWGSRPFSAFARKGRKVWTPNRKDAS